MGDFITANDIDNKDGFGKAIQSFNTILQRQLSSFVYEIDKSDKEKLHAQFFVPQTAFKKILLFLPSMAGWLLHAPLYFPLKKIIIVKTTETDHFDSLVVGLLFFAYPLYVGSATLSLFFFSGQWYSFWLLLIFPLTAWSHLQLKKQMD